MYLYSGTCTVLPVFDGLPAKGDKAEDWRGPWWVGYDDWRAEKRAKK